jgi:hypothetical protein
MSSLNVSEQRTSESLTHSSRPRRSVLHMIAQHQLLGIRMKITLLVHPVGNRVAVQGRARTARALAEAAPPEVAAASAATPE